MENANSKNLETALRNIDPTKAEPLAAKYKLVMDSIGSGLIDPKSDLAKSSKSYLERLASDLIDSSLMSRENQHVDVEILDRELDNVASALGLKLENINASEVAKAFDQLGAIFYELRINFRKSDYLAAYIKNAVPVKLDIASLAREMNTLWKKAANSNFFKSYLYANQDQLLTIVGQFCNGRQIEAFDTLSELNAKVAELHDPEVLQQKTGVILPDAQAQELMGTLKANQMTDAEIFKAINLVKEVNPEAFSKLKLAPNEMVVFLVGLVLDLKGGKRKNVKNGLLIEATASALDAKRAAEIADYSARLEKTIVGLREYREKNPDVATDAHIINVERNIAQLRANIVFTKFQQFMVNVQRYLASSYAEGLKNAGDFANVVADIFRRTSVNTLKQVAEKYGIQLPPDFAMLEKLDLDYQACKLDTSLKDELNQMSPDDKVLYSEFYKQFAEGKLDTSAKKEVVLHQIYEESQNLAMLSDKNEALIDRDRVAVYGLMDKYGSIDKVPANEKANVIAKLGTYFEVVKQGQAIVGKLLSTYIDVELLSPNEKVGEDKAAVAQEIAKVREYLTELGGGMEDIAQFLGKKDFKAPTENQIADSKLYSLILAKEVRPFNDKFDAVTHEVIDASNGLGFAMADLNKYGENPEYFEKMAIPPTRLFGHALGAFAGLENGIAGARDSISAEQTGLENYRNDILNGKVGVTNKYPVLKDHLIGLIDRSINRVKFLLNNADSPISLKKLDDLKKAHAELDAAYKNHLNHVLKGIITTTVIIAAAVAGGMFAAGLLVGPAAESLIMVSGTAAFGGTFASRLAMGLTNVVGLSDFSVKDEILSPKAFARDFLVSWGLAIGAFGLARGAMSGLNRGAASSRVWISRTSEKLLRGIGKARGAMSPVEWFGATEGALSKEMMKKFGVKFLTQFPQTEVENQVWEVNPLFGFVVSVLNATHGMHVDIKAVRATGAGVEKNAIVYRTATPEEFITQMEAYCSAKGATSFRAEVLPNKTIRFTVHDEVGGIVSLEVKPATTDLEPGVRVRRANGIQHENGQLVIRNAGDLAQCISRLQEQGFTVNVEGKTVKVSKGAAYSEEIKLEFEGTADVAVRTDILKVAKDLGVNVDPHTGDIHLESAGDFMSLMLAARNKGFNIVRSNDGSYRLQFGETGTNVNVKISPKAAAEINSLKSDYEVLSIEVGKAREIENPPRNLMEKIQLLGLKLFVKLSILLSPSLAYAKDLSIAEKALNYLEAPFKALFETIGQGSAILASVCGSYLGKIVIYDIAYKLIYKKGSPELAGLFQNKKAIAEAMSARKDIADEMSLKKGKKNLDAELKTVGNSLVIELDKFVNYLRKNEYGFFEVAGIRGHELDALSTTGRDILTKYKKDPKSVTRAELVDFEARVRAFAEKVENSRNSGNLVHNEWRMNKIVRVSVAAFVLLFYLNLRNEIGQAGNGEGPSGSSDAPVAPPQDIPLFPSAPAPEPAKAPASDDDGPKPAPAAPKPAKAPASDDDGPKLAPAPKPAKAPASDDDGPKLAPAPKPDKFGNTEILDDQL